MLLRAVTPLEGLDAMHVVRGPAARRDRNLRSGLVRFTQTLGIDGILITNLVTVDQGASPSSTAASRPRRTAPLSPGSASPRRGPALALLRSRSSRSLPPLWLRGALELVPPERLMLVTL